MGESPKQYTTFLSNRLGVQTHFQVIFKTTFDCHDVLFCQIDGQNILDNLFSVAWLVLRDCCPLTSLLNVKRSSSVIFYWTFILLCTIHLHHFEVNGSFSLFYFQ